MNPIINVLNTAGHRFCAYAGSVLIQSSLLIAVLVIIDLLLRRRVRAVVRYALWMLVFVKLLLPPGLSLPTGVGYYRPRPALVVREVAEPTAEETSTRRTVRVMPSEPVPGADSLATSQRPVSVNDSLPAPIPAVPSRPALTWPAWLFLGWLAGVLVLGVCLARRFRYVQRLVQCSRPASDGLQTLLAQCAAQLKLRHCPALDLSDEAPGPVVCRLLWPVVLIPATMADKIDENRLRTVLVHELAHIKRADLWVNFVQTLLLVVYFYHPLLWLVNAIVRRLREQAVDETVLVALDAEAVSYSTILVDLAETVFIRPVLGLRLIGIAESKKALEGRIRHMMTRPKPKSARVGTLGLLAIVVAAAVLLPMASATVSTPSGIPSDSNELALFLRDRLSENDRKIDNITFATECATVRSKKYRQTVYEHALAMGETEQEARAMLDSSRVRLVERFALDKDYCGRVERVSGRTNANGDWLGEPDSMVATWDGRTGVRFRKEPETGFFPYSAVIGERPMECSRRYAQPWREFLGWPAESFTDAIRRGVSVTAEKVRDAYRVEFDYGSGDKTVYVIDPAQGFSVVSRQRFSNDTLLASYTARFQEVNPGLWFPVEGEIVNGSVESGEARTIFEVSQVRVNAPDFYDNLHSVDFPKGTSVFDQRTRLRYVIGEKPQGESPRLIIDNAIPLPQGEDWDARLESGARLVDLGKALLGYANDHDDRFPDEMADASDCYPINLRWLQEHVTYLGRGKTMSAPPDTVLAYDKTLLVKGQGTLVLLAESRVDFRSVQELEALGIRLMPTSEITPQMRVESQMRLAELGKALLLYARDHDGRLPERIEDVRDDVGMAIGWLTENVAYWGKGMTTRDNPVAPIAYDKTLIQSGAGTNVLYLDAHVTFESRTRLEEIGIKPPPKSTAVVQEEATIRTRVESQTRLKDLGKALLIYANDHGDEFPEMLSDLRDEVGVGMSWLLENVTYLGKDVSVTDQPSRVLAYDKTLLAAGYGTNVLYLDSHVAFEMPETLDKLGIRFRPKSPAEIQKEAELQARVRVLTKLKSLALAAFLFAGDHNDRFAGSLEDLKPYLGQDEDLWAWVSENVEYVGGNTQATDAPPAVRPVAYCRLSQGAHDELVVAFQDGRVETFKGPRLQEELKILTAHGSAQEMRRDSAVNLSRLAKALLGYACDHDDRFPDEMADAFDCYPINLPWLREHVTYLGRGKTLTAPPDSVLAYDKTLLEKGAGTLVLFGDTHVDFRSRQELGDLAIVPVPAAGASGLDESTVGRASQRRDESSVHWISGVVRDTQGMPVGGATVSLMPWLGIDVVTNAVVVTDADGAFAFETRPSSMMGGFRGQETLWLLVRQRERNLAAAVKIGETVESLNVTVTDGMMFSGRAVDTEGKSVPTAEVSLRLWLSHRGYSQREPTEIDAEGCFEIRAVPRGYRCSVSVHADGYGEPSVEIEKDAAVRGRIELEPLVLRVAKLPISGVVVDELGRPVASARVFANGNGQPHREIRTNSRGEFTFENMCEGAVFLHANAGDAGQMQGQARTLGGSTEARIVLRKY